MSKIGKRRERLFDLFSKNLALYQPEYADHFACPLCCRLFPRQALVGLSPDVSLAHVVPKSLGGKSCTLTCTACNNDNGTEIERFLADRLVAEDRVAGIGTVNARMSGSFGDVGVEWQMSPDRRWSLYGVPKQSNPAHVQALTTYLNEWAADRSERVEFTLSFDYRHRPRRTEAAIYQAAFLLMFHYFGYEFAFHPDFAAMRERVMNPDQDGWKTQISIASDASVAALLGLRNEAVLFRRDPLVMLALLRMRPRDGQTRVFAVVLPGFETPVQPVVEGTFTAKLLPYCPQALLDTKHLLQHTWFDFVDGRL